jgi:2-acylglycerol O-acyltransferase 2
MPLSAKLQAGAVVAWSLIVPISLAIYIYSLYIKALLPFSIAYFMFILQDKAPWMGARKLHFVRNWTIWHLFRDYFPITLVKTVELDSSKNYIFGYHPYCCLTKPWNH